VWLAIIVALTVILTIEIAVVKASKLSAQETPEALVFRAAGVTATHGHATFVFHVRVKLPGHV